MRCTSFTADQYTAESAEAELVAILCLWVPHYTLTKRPFCDCMQLNNHEQLCSFFFWMEDLLFFQIHNPCETHKVPGTGGA